MYLLHLTLILICAVCSTVGYITWNKWSSCSKRCGGGTKTRTGVSHGDGWIHEGNDEALCNEFCYNGGNYSVWYSDPWRSVRYTGCNCHSWTSGQCCEEINECARGTANCEHLCHNHHNSYTCSCRSGYTLLSDRHRCGDVNECADRRISKCKHTCENSLGSFQCGCWDGFSLASNGYDCDDIDECATRTLKCEQTCHNNVGSYTCGCRSGFKLHMNGYTCQDLDECTTGDAKCEHTCENTPGSYNCGCMKGYVLQADGHSCQDRDECSDRNGGCSHICKNTPGSYVCKCRDGYRLQTDQMSCTDIDECSEGLSKCSQTCINTDGSYTCSCGHGYILAVDGVTCEDKNDCEGVICENGGTCIDNVGSYTCLCTKGITGPKCEKDVNECSGYLNGGCEERCVNTLGSFHCECIGNKTLQNDSYSCSGYNGGSPGFFSRYGLLRKLLPRGCSTLSFSACIHAPGLFSIFSSTSPWYQHRSNRSVLFTFGIVFIELNSLAFPISMTGLTIRKSATETSLLVGATNVEKKDGQTIGENRTHECLTFDTTPRDIHDILAHNSFLGTFFENLEDVLPDWIRFSKYGTTVVGLNDIHVDMESGAQIQKGICKGAPLLDDVTYTVLRFGNGFQITVYGQTVELPPQLENEQYCVIIDVCRDYGGSAFLVLPENSRDVLTKFEIVNKLALSRGISFQPVGLGISLSKHIRVKTEKNSLQFWNGDNTFSYPLMQEANIWIGGGLTYENDIATIAANADVFMTVPKLDNLMMNIFYDEWSVYVKGSLKTDIHLKFPLFGKEAVLRFDRLGSAVYEARASFGGQVPRIWCGENSNPEGIFMTTFVDANPFRDIPLFGRVFGIRGHVDIFIGTDTNPTQSSNHTIYIIKGARHVQEIIENFVNVSVKTIENYSNLLLGQSFTYLKEIKMYSDQILNLLISSMSQPTDIRELFTHLDNMTNNIFVNLTRSKDSFVETLDKTNPIAVYNASTLLETELSLIKNGLNSLVVNVQGQVNSLVQSIHGFGLRFHGKLYLLLLEIDDILIEVVYSLGRLGKCNKYNAVYTLLEDEKALRIYGQLPITGKPLHPLLVIRRGIGVAWSLETTGKFLAQLHVDATFLGIRIDGDMFVSNKGLYLSYTGDVWNVFRAKLDISAYHAKSWQELTFDVKGQFLADADGDGHFGDSYLSSLRRVTQYIADEADKRITGVQHTFTDVQNKLTDAQNWLEDKKAIVYSANAAFDKAVRSMDTAKDALERAKVPFQNAIDSLDEAERKVDSICRIRHCSRVCVPGLKCHICWKKVWFMKIPYPCCSFTDCMFSFPDPICAAFNAGCFVVRGIAYAALELAKLAVRVPMLVLDGAKLAVSAAQFIVDHSRVLLDIAVAALDVAELGLEGCKAVLEGAKLALEGVKQVVKLGLSALNFIIQYGLQSILDVRNCGFELKLSTHDQIVFDVHCEVSAFRTKFRIIKLRINFASPVQSMWYAAKATIESILGVIGDVFAGRRRREIQEEALSGLHKVIRLTRESDTYDPELEATLNSTINTVFKTTGFEETYIGTDYDHRKAVFADKCEKFTIVFEFLREALGVLYDLTEDTALTLTNASDLHKNLQTFNIDDIKNNFTVESIGIDKEKARTYFNISITDLTDSVEQTKNNLSNDPFLANIRSVANEANAFLANQTADSNKIMMTSQWIAAMENVTATKFDNETCISFMDCAHYSVATMYELFIAVEIKGSEVCTAHISSFEDLFLELTGNLSHTIEDTYALATKLLNQLDGLKENTKFCSQPPAFLSLLQNQTTTEGKPFHLTCNATGDPTPAFLWYKDDSVIEGENSLQLQFENVSESDAAKYRCVAGNLVANLSSKDAWLQVVNREKEDIVVIPVVVNENHHEEFPLPVVLASTISALLVLIVSVMVTWRIYNRNQVRKLDTVGSLASFNMVRPEIDRPVFKAKKIAWQS